MKRYSIFFLLTFNLISLSICGQDALEADLPAKFDELRRVMKVDHFPSPVFASVEVQKTDTIYIWKHNTSVMSTTETLEIIECGAYIFYNNQWNLRASYPPKFFKENFNCPKGILKAGQVYTFVDNWRTDTRLYGGWAMWYFIAKTNEGELVYGLEPLDTVGETYSETNQK